MSGPTGFHPTCPRCWLPCPPGSTRCPTCQTWLMFDPPRRWEADELARRLTGRQAPNDDEPLEAAA